MGKLSISVQRCPLTHSQAHTLWLYTIPSLPMVVVWRPRCTAHFFLYHYRTNSHLCRSHESVKFGGGR